MEREIGENKKDVSKTGFTIINDNFLDNWSGVIGVGPTALYIALLKYCYGNKTHAWPSVGTLAKNIGVTKNSVRKYREVLIKYGFIEKMYRRKSADGSYQTNVYQIVRSDKLPNMNDFEVE